MKEAIALFIVFPLLCFFMFQPFMNDIVHKRGVILETTAKKAVQLAAEDGYVSPRVQNIVKQDLQALHWDTAQLSITGSPTSAPTARGNLVTINLKYPTGPLYIFVNFFSSDGTAQYYSYTFSQMSEYIP